MTLFNSYYPLEDHNYSEDDRLSSLYLNYKSTADCICENAVNSLDPELCVPSLIILLHQMHQEILSLKEQVEYLKDPESYEYGEGLEP